MVASRARHDASVQFLSRQMRHFVVCATDLEGKHWLRIFPLQVDLIVEQGAQVLGMLQFGLDGRLVDSGVQHLAKISHSMLLRIEQNGNLDALFIRGEPNHFVGRVVVLVGIVGGNCGLGFVSDRKHVLAAADRCC